MYVTHTHTSRGFKRPSPRREGSIAEASVGGARKTGSGARDSEARDAKRPRINDESRGLSTSSSMRVIRLSSSTPRSPSEKNAREVFAARTTTPRAFPRREEGRRKNTWVENARHTRITRRVHHTFVA
jgi:hypothetical protein